MAKTKATVITSFSARLPFAEQAADQHAAEMVTAITAETRDALRVLVRRAIAEGIPPRDLARLVRDVVGLSTPQALAALAYRESLTSVGLSPDLVETRTARYAAKLRRQRAVMIARTEVMRALNAGQDAGWAHAQQAGLLGPSARRVWMTNPKACKACDALHGKTAPVGEPFDGGIRRPPRHPSCRCTLGLDPG